LLALYLRMPTQSTEVIPDVPKIEVLPVIDDDDLVVFEDDDEVDESDIIEELDLDRLIANAID
jgi:hypothetical protein